MTDWRETTLGEALEIRHGYAFRGEYFRDEGELIVLTPGNFYDKGGFKRNKRKGGKEKYYDGPFPPQYLLEAGDVVVAMTEQADGLLGSTATIPTSNRYLHNQRLGLLRVAHPETLDLRFCYHLLNASLVRQQIQATATGSKVRHTAPERIRAVRIPLPDVATQRVTAAMLDTLDDLIENNRRRIELLEQMAQEIYREWFVRFRYPGHEDVALVESTLGLIPAGWDINTCGETLTVLTRLRLGPSSLVAELVG
jgi:type I restriction enzyme S subunit